MAIENILGDPNYGQSPSISGGFGFSALGSAQSTESTPGGVAASPVIGNFGLGGALGTSAFTNATTTGGNWSSGGGSTVGSSQPSVTDTSFSGSNVGGTATGNFGSFANGGVSTGGDGTAGGTSFSGSSDNPLVVSGIKPSGADSQAGSQSSSGATSGGGSSGGLSAGPSDTTPTGTGTINTQAPSGGGILDNPLNPYGAPTYHFRFYVTAQNGSGSEVTIAESGKTGFSIKDVKIQGFVGPNQTTRNTVQTSVSITVVEAMGTSFLDGLVVAHQRVGTVNYQKAFYWLELYFLGYTEAGAVVNPITEGMPSGGKWKWKLVISNIETHLNEGGAIYTLQCTIIHDTALESEWLKTTEPFKVESATVGEFFEKFATALNQSVVRNYQDQLTTYAFKLQSYAGMPDPSKFKLIEADAQPYDQQRAKSMTEGTRDIWNANITRGTNITEICENVIGISLQGRNLSIWGNQDGSGTGGGAGSGGDVNKTPTGEFRTGVFYRAYPEVKFGDFHPATGNYKKTITYYIKPFRSLATQLHPDESKKANKDKAIAVAKPATRKRYDYIFTGMNTDVINFDIKFNTAWQAALPRFGGWDYFNDMVQVNAMYDKKAADALKSYRQNVSNAQSAASTASSAQKALDSGKVTNGPDTVNLSDARSKDLLNNFLTMSRDTLAQNNSAALAEQKQLEAANNKMGALGTNGTNFVEDILAQGSGLETYISFAQSTEGARRAAGTGAAGAHGNRGRSVYGALLEQLYDPTMFQVVDLTIRGDPFWLGDAYETMFFGTSAPGKTSPDPAAGDTFFTLFFKYPNGVHEDTGSVTFRAEETYSGLYRCATVESIFSDGLFTQVLHANRMPKVDSATAASLGGGKDGAGTAGSGGGSTLSDATNALNTINSILGTNTGTTGTGTGTGTGTDAGGTGGTSTGSGGTVTSGGTSVPSLTFANVVGGAFTSAGSPSLTLGTPSNPTGFSLATLARNAFSSGSSTPVGSNIIKVG